MAWTPLNNLNKRISFLDTGDLEILKVWAAVKSVRAEEIKGAVGTITNHHIVFLVRSDNPDLKQVENYMKVRYDGEDYEIDFILWQDAQSGFFTEIWVSR